jgi:hypothetical protein
MPSSPRRVLVYGNCQAGAAARFVRGAPALAALLDVEWWLEGTTQLMFAGGDVHARLPDCDLLFAQVGTWQTGASQAPVPPGCEVVFFPPLSLQCLWPLHVYDLLTLKPEPPAYPYGRYPYGDRRAISLMDAGDDVDEVMRRYLGEDISEGLSRFYEITKARQEMLDEKCHTDFSRVIYDQFRERPLFRTIKHPGDLLMRKVVALLVEAAGGTWTPLEAPRDKERYRVAIPGCGASDLEVERGYWDLDPTVNVPIHPQVIRHFGLTWVTEQTVYRHNDQYVTFEQYLRSYVTYRKQALEAA